MCHVRPGILCAPNGVTCNAVTNWNLNGLTGNSASYIMLLGPDVDVDHFNILLKNNNLLIKYDITNQPRQYMLVMTSLTDQQKH